MRRVVVVAVSLVLLAVASSGRAEQIVEVWRSPFVGYPSSVSAVQSDGSCWVADGAGIARVAGDCTVLARMNEAAGAAAVGANAVDGGCWAVCGNELVRYSATGAEIARSGGFDRPASLSVNATDGSCWVADTGHDQVVHLAADGRELWRGGQFTNPISISVDSHDGSCWVADSSHSLDYGKVVHLSEAGVEVWRGYESSYPSVVCADPRDGSCLVGDGAGAISKVASDGTELWRRELAPPHPVAISLDPTDDSYWVGTFEYPSASAPAVYTVFHFAADGSVIWQGQGDSRTFSLSVDPTDGSCWVATGRRLIRLAATGELLAEGIAVCPKGLAVNPADGSCWVAATPDEVLHIAHDGAMLSRSGDRTKAFGVSVDQNDGSCWVAQEGVYIIYTSPPAGAAAVGPAPMSIIHGQWVVHLASDGTELWHDDLWPSSVSASSSDGTCWMASRSGSVSHWGPDGTQVSGTGAGWLVAADQTDGSCRVGADDAIVHLGADGTELWRGPAAGIRSLSVNSSDGSCWVGTNTEVIHLGADGTELWRGSGFNARSVSVDPADGSCWVADAGAGQVVHLAADGTPLCRGGLFDWTRTYDPGIPGKRSQLLAADPSDGSCWVADTAGGNLVRVAQRPGFPDVPPDFWSYAEIEACVDQRIVFGYLDGLYHPEIEVTRDQMAVYIARALVRPSGDAGIPDPEPPPTFPDVLPDFWAYRQIEYAVSQNVVQGYPDGTYQPSLVVDRGQMAVYIARAMVAPTGDAVIADPEPPYTFPDVPGDDNAWAWCHKHVEFLAGREVVQGYPDGLYHPENAVTRDQMAVYIARAFELPM